MYMYFKMCTDITILSPSPNNNRHTGLILSCLLWTVEQYLSFTLTRDSHTITPPQNLNVDVLHSVLLYLPCARTPDRCRDPESLCWRWPSLCTGSCRKSSMIHYGSVSLLCTWEKKHCISIIDSPYELVHLQWLLGISYFTVKLTMRGFSLFFLKKPQKDDTGYIFLKYENFYLKIIDKLNEWKAVVCKSKAK